METTPAPDKNTVLLQLNLMTGTRGYTIAANWTTARTIHFGQATIMDMVNAGGLELPGRIDKKTPMHMRITLANTSGDFLRTFPSLGVLSSTDNMALQKDGRCELAFDGPVRGEKGVIILRCKRNSNGTFEPVQLEFTVRFLGGNLGRGDKSPFGVAINCVENAQSKRTAAKRKVDDALYAVDTAEKAVAQCKGQVHAAKRRRTDTLAQLYQTQQDNAAFLAGFDVFAGLRAPAQ